MLEENFCYQYSNIFQLSTKHSKIKTEKVILGEIILHENYFTSKQTEPKGMIIHFRKPSVRMNISTEWLFQPFLHCSNQTLPEYNWMRFFIYFYFCTNNCHTYYNWIQWENNSKIIMKYSILSGQLVMSNEAMQFWKSVSQKTDVHIYHQRDRDR